MLNCTEEDLQSFERLLFVVEQAHWFYEDKSRKKEPDLKSYKEREFAQLGKHQTEETPYPYQVGRSCELNWKSMRRNQWDRRLEVKEQTGRCDEYVPV